jgi:hypothetical protein
MSRWSSSARRSRALNSSSLRRASMWASGGEMSQPNDRLASRWTAAWCGIRPPTASW